MYKDEASSVELSGSSAGFTSNPGSQYTIMKLPSAYLAAWLVPGLVAAQDIRPYPLPSSVLSTTEFLNHSSYIQGFDEPQWYLDNIPFIDVPDPSLQEVYYYRASVIKRHLKYAHEGHGYSFTEFIHPVSWGELLELC